MAKKKQETQTEPSDGTIAVNDAWTGMLAISLLALIAGAGILGYDMMQYTDKPPAVPTFSSPSSLKKADDAGAPKTDAPKADAPNTDAVKDAVKDAKKA
jgi:hypothetical protein